MYIYKNKYIQNKFNLYPFVDYITFTVSGYYNWNSAIEKENGLINGPNHMIPSMNRVKKIKLLIDYQYTLLKTILFNSSMLDQ